MIKNQEYGRVATHNTILLGKKSPVNSLYPSMARIFLGMVWLIFFELVVLWMMGGWGPTLNPSQEGMTNSHLYPLVVLVLQVLTILGLLSCIVE